MVSALGAATLGTVVPVSGGAADIVLDEARGRLYLVNTTRNQVEIYLIASRRFLAAIPVEPVPLSAAMSRSGRFLYVTSHAGTSLNIIDLDRLAVTDRLSLPARPEGVAVGADERVLITTVGTGSNNQTNILLIYDPNADGTQALRSVTVTPPPPLDPRLPAPVGRSFLASRSQLISSRDGNLIIGVNIPSGAARVVFVYEAASGTVLRSRAVNGVSNVLSISPDNSKFMAGLHLFDTATLAVLAQQNLANSPYPFAPGTNFNIEQNQGGSVFTPDGAMLFSAFNSAPVQNPPARPNVSQLLVNDPDNLLIQTAIQMPENLAGKIVIASDSSAIFGLSESGFIMLPLAALQMSAIAVPETPVVQVVNDQCGVHASKRTATVIVRNQGSGRMTASALAMVAGAGLPAATTPAGPGGMDPGTGGTGGTGRPADPGAGATPAAPAAATASFPTVRMRLVPEGVALDFTFNPVVARSLGTATPSQFLVQSPEAINIPPAVTVYQNHRDAEARGEIIPVPTSMTLSAGLLDMVHDAPRQRLYLANAGMNRVEVFDMRQRRFLAPIKVGQLPSSLAITPDGNFLYVANSGGESISVVDLHRDLKVDRIVFPATPFNANVALVTPNLISVGVRGPLVVMSNGSLWRVVGNEAIPRTRSAIIGALTVPAPRSLAASPGGEFIFLLAGNGWGYLFDSTVDEFVQGRLVISGAIQGYFGPVTVGPRGQYIAVNNLVLNSSLTPTVVPAVIAGQTLRPVSAVAGVGPTTYARFSQPFRANATAVVTTPPTVELVDANTGAVMRSANALEGPLTIVAGTGRANVPGRTMTLDAAGSTAYLLTAAGLSVVSMEPIPAAERPVINGDGVVNVASYLPSPSPGSLFSIFGRNLGTQVSATTASLPVLLGGMCVTLNDQALPLAMTGPSQINAQIPPTLAAGRYNMIIRSVNRNLASVTRQITVARYSPAVFVNPEDGQAAIYHPDGSPVTKANPARRDRDLILYASGLGATKGGRVTAGQPSPADPLAVTEKVQVFFGDKRYREAEMIVEWSGLVPGLIGVYQIDIRVPGARIKGDNLPVTLRIGNVDSPATGPVIPVTFVD